MATWALRDVSIGFALQSDLTTTATTGFEYLPAEVAVPDLVRDAEDLQFATAQVGAYQPPAVGGKHGSTFTVRIPLRGFKSGYDATAEQPGVDADVISREIALLGAILGSNNSAASSNANLMKGAHLQASNAYTANDVSSATATAVTVQAASGANYAVGDFACFDDNGGQTAPQLGFIKSIAGDVLTLFEGSANTASSNDENYGTVTAYLSNAEPLPLTFRIVGDQTQFGQIFTGCIPVSGSITLNANQTSILEVTFQSTSREWDATIGGLQTSDAFTRLPPIIGNNGGRIAVGGSQACGLTDVTLSFENELKWFECASGAEGYSAVKVVSRAWSLSYAVPHDSADTITSGEHQHEYGFEQGMSGSVSITVGTTVGRIMSILCPSWHIYEQPALEDIDGVLYHRLNLRPGEYSGDGASTGAGNSILRIGFA